MRARIFFIVAAMCVAGATVAWSQDKPAAPANALIMIKMRAADMEKSVAFYKNLLGMQEVFRIKAEYPPGNTTNQLVEVGLKFGATVEAARADKGPTLALMHREHKTQTYAAPDDLPNFIITVPDVNAVMAKARSMGVAPYLEPYDAGPATKVAFIKDPSGNVVEFIQAGKR
jgi:catechol 2,3-dioxygenase-like lactoylglutathione lyase family enzyme